MTRATWIEPRIERGVARWDRKCEAECTTDETRNYRLRTGKPTTCGLNAKVDYAGTGLCINHAKTRALTDALGGITNSRNEVES